MAKGQSPFGGLPDDARRRQALCSGSGPTGSLDWQSSPSPIRAVPIMGTSLSTQASLTCRLPEDVRSSFRQRTRRRNSPRTLHAQWLTPQARRNGVLPSQCSRSAVTKLGLQSVGISVMVLVPLFPLNHFATPLAPDAAVSRGASSRNQCGRKQPGNQAPHHGLPMPRRVSGLGVGGRGSSLRLSCPCAARHRRHFVRFFTFGLRPPCTGSALTVTSSGQDSGHGWRQPRF
jgi:hypothetical protein